MTGKISASADYHVTRLSPDKESLVNITLINYSTVVNTCTTRFDIKNSACSHNLCYVLICFSQQREVNFLYTINRLLPVSEAQLVH